MNFTIDRFEGDFAVVELENKSMINIPLMILPKDSKEGDILRIIKDKKETDNRKYRIEDKFKSLFED